MFSFRVLGGATLESDDGPVHGRAAHKRRLALLAVLAVARGRTVARERLVGLLWPDTPSQAARHSLSESLSVLRRELEEDVFVCVGDDLALNLARVSCDLAAFEAALEAGDPAGAVAVYHGPFLDGFYVSEAPDFERWAEGERERLGRAYATVLESLAEEREAKGDVRGAAEWWRRLAAHDPYSSRVALRLMRALEAAGEREAALRHATVHEAFLREELETEPSPEVRAFVERLRAAPAPVASVAAPDREEARQGPASEAGGGHGEPAPDGGVVAVDRAPPAAVRATDAGAAVQAGSPAPASVPPPDGAERRTAAVWLADVVDYSALLARDSAAAAALLAVLQDVARREVRRAGGHVVEFIGDAVLAEFSDTAACARAAVRLVLGVEKRARETGASATLRVGIHVGEVATADDGGIYGEPVSVASLLQARAEPGQVLVSAEVKDQLLGAAEFRFAGRGLVTVPGRADPVPTFDLQLERKAGRAPPGEAGAPAPRRRRLIPGLLAAGSIAVIVAVAVLLSGRGRARDAGSGNPSLDPNRIAILYSVPDSTDPFLRSLAKGFTDHLIYELSQVEALDVVPPSGVRQFRDGAVGTDSVARALRAGTLLESSLSRSGDRLLLFLHLIDAASGERLRTTKLEARMGDPFELEEKLAQEASRFLRWRLGRSLEVRTHSSGTRSVRARERVFLAERAREDAKTRANQADILEQALALRLYAQADSFLIEAEEADPRWPEPSALRAWIAIERADRPHTDVERLLGEALGHAERALQRGIDRVRVLEIQGNVRWRLANLPQHADSAEWLRDAASRDLRAVIDAEPRNAAAMSIYSQVLRFQGDHLGSYLMADRARKADAYLLRANVVYDRLFRSAVAFGRWDLARKHCAEGAREFPDDWRFVECRLVILGLNDSEPPDVGAAEAALRAIDAKDPPAASVASPYSPFYRQLLFAAVLARAGQT
ncbi:MAG TPA: BTAD domain-containing putative transcriptional regulator, partial [Longimicrobiaceae bacterium]|nr:BTAD domain-containing putative transcriptional regulator [Longimicrobiaceae bacterium]